MKARELKIGIGLVIVAIALWFGFRALNPPRVSEGPAPLALNTDGDDESNLLKTYSIEKLFEAANVLRVAFDATLETEGEPASVAGCSLSHEEAERYLNGIRILIDGAKPTEKMKYAANPADYIKTHLIESCEVNCNCAGYADLLSEDETTPEISPETKALVESLSAKSSGQTPEAVKTCADKQTWFCKSRLHRYLENDASGS